MKKIITIVGLLAICFTLHANAFDSRPMLEGEDQQACESRIGKSSGDELVVLITQRVQAQSDSQNLSLTPLARKEAYFKALDLLSKEKANFRQSGAALESGCGSKIDWSVRY